MARESGGIDRGERTFSTPLCAHRNRWVLGVAAGFAAHFQAPVWLVRLLWVVSVPVTFGLTAIAYLVLAAILPTADDV